MIQHRPLTLCFISNPQSFHTRRWLEWFAARGHIVRLIADAPIGETWPGIEMIDLTRRFNLRVVRFALWGVWTRRLVKGWRPDILHAHRVASGGWLGAFTGYHPFVVAPWGSDLLQHPERSWIAARLAGYVLRRADHVVVNSNALRQRALQFGACSENISMIQFGIDLKIFSPDQGSSGWRDRLGLGDSPVLLSSRAISPIYNTEIIIEAFASVLGKIPSAKLVLFHYNVNDAYKSKLDSQIEALHIESSIHWVGPLLNQEEIARLYHLADAVISVPSSDSSPASVLEAMACSKPVIVSDLPTLHDWIVDGENGIFVPIRDPVALANAIIHLLASPEVRGQMGMNGRKIVAVRADMDNEMRKMEEIYYSLAEKSAHG